MATEMKEEIYDTKHREIVNFIVKKFKNNPKTKFIDIEVPFNDYGNRGVVDILVKYRKRIFNITLKIIEVKTNLRNFGESIRQLKNAKAYFEKENKNIVMILALLNTKENFEHFKQNYHSLSILHNFEVQFVNPKAEEGKLFFYKAKFNDINTDELFNELCNLGFN